MVMHEEECMHVSCLDDPYRSYFYEFYGAGL